MMMPGPAQIYNSGFPSGGATIAVDTRDDAMRGAGLDPVPQSRRSRNSNSNSNTNQTRKAPKTFGSATSDSGAKEAVPSSTRINIIKQN